MMEGNSEYSIPWDDGPEAEMTDDEGLEIEVKVKVKDGKKDKVQTLSVDFDALLPHIGKVCLLFLFILYNSPCVNYFINYCSFKTP